ncbi:fumarylacetoacetase [Tropicibacter naphthalenivorans]|uniref:fumarylacetoacetase n=1 Tax=Tropicibacter naphthalenivorans TaxID=441103 RepID=A0A0P1GXF1_9RHOB|nr:fumarylacetoacetase [Tropicibacter naphthalenivorans]CUH81243.1 fumarylacetoacetase [Tropicibacter naphthalenivorans]SMC97899.1 fumarylacetoacetate hydrolase [Tropicibacter naphthalenivorans]
MPLMTSWVDSANTPETDFPLNNLPYGAFVSDSGEQHCGVAIGDMILDVTALEADGVIAVPDEEEVFFFGDWTEFMALGPAVWAGFRAAVTELLREDYEDPQGLVRYMVPQVGTQMCLPFTVAEYTDFYASFNHASNVGTMFRGPENALPANWLSVPIGYNGRASSVQVSGTDVRRPWGQLKSPDAELPVFAPCKRFDIELEMGAIVGQPSTGPVTVAEADEMIFGYVLLNDWSARDIQAWEYMPLGPFQSKATATTLSPWIIPKAALEPFRCPTPERKRPLLDYLTEPGPMLYDIALEVGLAPEGAPETVISRTNYNTMYYSSAQQLAHHTTSGCPMNVGDLLGSGTISGTEKDQRGALLEITWGGQDPITLDTGETRAFVEDGDTLTLRGHALGDGFRIGFGDCTAKVLPALEDPYKR